ncbi:MAG TPA: asparagine synthase-related protein [Thermoanaerobaculia bacterium]|nr:asparagine synthase-related protein [Thermoanaerobaculia bacterium]
MSALCLISSAEAPVERERFARLLGAIEHRGGDLRRSVGDGWFELGVQARWITPEEEGERQPLESRDGRLVLAWCGRLDNRDELHALLGNVPSDASDAALLLESWQRWGEASVRRVLGPFALAVVDRWARTVTLARDPLGQRGLVYAGDGRRLVVASEEAALIEEGTATAALDEGAMVQVFAAGGLAPEATFFRDCTRLPAGSLLRWGPGRLSVERWWRPATPERRRRRDVEAAEEVRATLEQAVAARLRCRGRAAVMMSGGLDSTSVAGALAGLAPRPLAFSWMFEELVEADEREWIEAIRDGCGLDHVEVPADREWPLRRLDAASVNPNVPLDNAYRPLVEATYRGAAARGASVVMNGEGADQLYADSSYWLRDALRSGRWLAAGVGIFRELLGRRPPHLQRRPTLRSALGLLRPRRPALQGPPSWLTPAAQERWTPPPRFACRTEAGWARAIDGWDARAAEFEEPLAARHGLEVWRPYRDLRLLKVFLALPADQLYRPTWTKWVTRRALRGVLPEEVRLRRRGTTLRPLLVRGLEQRERARVEALLGRDDALWTRYLRREWLMPGGRLPADAWSEGMRGYLGWLALTCEIWRLAREDPELLGRIGVDAV